MFTRNGKLEKLLNLLWTSHTCIMATYNYLDLLFRIRIFLNVYQKRETREVIKFVLDLTYLYYTNLQLLGLVVSDKNIFKCLPETGN